jgi:VanZ family protein
MIKPTTFSVFAILTGAYAVFLFYLSSLSSPPEVPELGFLYEFGYLLKEWGLSYLIYPFYFAYQRPDKFAHFVLYTGLGLLLNPMLSSSRNGMMSKYAVPFSLLLGAVYAISDEFHQSFVPYRSASVTDFCADFLGLLFAQFLILLYHGIKRLLKIERGK